jgi:hypothetical protein
MLLLRILIPLTFFVIIAGFFAYALTRKTRYFTFSLRLLQISLGIVLLIFVLLFLERIVFVPL